MSAEKLENVSIETRSIPALAHNLHDNPLAHRVLAARGVEDAAELAMSLAGLPKPDLLPDIEKAVARLMTARSNHEKILVVGDYDCDGATSTAVAVLGLELLGFSQISYFIPSRFKYGYGLSSAIVDLGIQEFDAQLILTVDNGVASVEGVERANTRGVDVIVTDHHLAPDVLPAASAIVNPNLPDANFPGKNLAGVGVIFYTLLALRAHLHKLNDPCGRAQLARLLDLVAIGTVADLVKLDASNRILVEQGLRRIKAGCSRPGVLALLAVADKPADTLTTQDIGFALAPRLNAAGRLEDMRIGVQCLLAEDSAAATDFALQLNKLNQKRRNIEVDMRASAEEQLSLLTAEPRENPFGICVMDESWHEGVIGILAGRIKDALNKPAIVFTHDDHNMLKGSARSIKGVHIRDVLQTIVAEQPGLIVTFGGHAMAAGLTLPVAHFERFRLAFDKTIKRILKGRHQLRHYLTDGALSQQELTLDNALLLSELMPWGQGFEQPVFKNDFVVKSVRAVGKGHLKLSLALLSAESAKDTVDAIAFNCAQVLHVAEKVHIVYVLDVNRWRNAQILQLRVEHIERLALR